MDLSSTIHINNKVQPGHVILVSGNESLEIDIGERTQMKSTTIDANDIADLTTNKNIIQIHDNELDEYDSKDIHKYSVTIAGCTYDFYFVKKGTKKSKALLIAKKKREITMLKSKLEIAEKELDAFISYL